MQCVQRGGANGPRALSALRVRIRRSEKLASGVFQIGLGRLRPWRQVNNRWQDQPRVQVVLLSVRAEGQENLYPQQQQPPLFFAATPVTSCADEFATTEGE